MQLLEDLRDALRAAGALRGRAEIIDARVPIVKCSLAGAGARGLRADISLGAVNGAAAAAFLRAQVRAVPPLRPLALVLKALLRQAGANAVFLGGLSSYTLVNMVVAFLQREGFRLAEVDEGALASADAAAEGLREAFAFLGDLRGPAPETRQPLARTPDLGRLLWGFCRLFGHEFDYRREAVSAARGGVVRKLKPWRQPRRPWLLAVEDPQEPGHDVASGSYLAREVRALLAGVADRLGELLEDLEAQRGGGLDESDGPALLSTVLDVGAALDRGVAGER